MIGDYHIVGKLGGGSMAELFLAQKMSRFGFIRRAVVKRVKRSRPDYPQLQEMLLDEARATACFDHPNLVSLFDVGETEQGVYLALEYIEGSDLRRVNATLRTRKEALPFELAAFITVEVLRGLHHAHTSKDQEGQSLEIIHRDVNPSNVLIAHSGHIKLADFGVVRMRERVQQKTEPGLVKGKYAYLAPEYIAGEPCSIQTDVYAAGIMLFELLSGRECFSGKTAYEVMWKIVNKGVPMYRLEREGVPEDLQRIVQRSTAMAPERRYQTAQDMANALEAWLMRSGRHATPWVLSVFFHRHELLPPRQEKSQIIPLAHLGDALGQYPSRNVSDNSSIGPSVPRVVDPSLTPLPSELTDGLGMDELSPLKSESVSDHDGIPGFMSNVIKEAEGEAEESNAGDHEHPPDALSERGTLPSREPPPRFASGLNFTAPVVHPVAPLVDTSDEPALVPTPPMDLSSPPFVPPRFPPEKSQVPPASPRQSFGRGLTAPPNESYKSGDNSKDLYPPEPPSVPTAPMEVGYAKLSPEAPPRSGKMEEIPAVELLDCIFKGQHSVVVEFRCGLIWKKVKIFKGQPIGVTSNMGMELIGEHLVKSRLITRDRLHRALQKSEREGKALTATLIEDGALAQDVLERELGKNLAARLNEVLEWRWGTFELKNDVVTPAEYIPRLDTARLLETARQARQENESTQVKEDSGEFNPKRNLEKAIDIARSIASSSGRGQIERPWRPKDS